MIQPGHGTVSYGKVIIIQDITVEV